MKDKCAGCTQIACPVPYCRDYLAKTEGCAFEGEYEDETEAFEDLLRIEGEAVV